MLLVITIALARLSDLLELRVQVAALEDAFEARKLIERAKGLVMKQKNVGEEEAYRVMRKLAMDRSRKLLEIAQQIIDVSELMS